MDLMTSGRAPKPTKRFLLTCDCGCGEQIRRYKNKVSARNYVNQQHRAAAQKRECTEAQCGPYLELFTTYMEGTAPRIYRDLASVRASLRPFFLFLSVHDIFCLDEVTAGTVTAFKLWGFINGYRSAAGDTSALSTFFDWAILEERYTAENPVVPAIHAKRSKPRTGRPYSTEEMLRIRQLLDERGNARLRAFFEIAAESGMRAGEICRLRIQDISLTNNQLLVGLPNKTMTERTARFYIRAGKRVSDWLEERKKDCGHDYLFHNYLGQPLRWDSIKREFNRALCIRYEGKIRNATGVGAFSLHRLRHTSASTLASNGASASTLLKCLGWASPASVDGYVRIDHDSKKRSFVEAMRKVEEGSGDNQTQVLTPDEFLFSIGG